MKALVHTAPLKLEYRDVPEPRPNDDEVLVRIKAVAICGSDVHGYTGTTGRRIPPVIMGHEAAGVVEAIGRNSREIAVPVAAFSSYDPESGVLVLKVSEKQLASAPEFHDSDLDNPAFAETIYRFFGLAPLWTEERKEPRRPM